MASDKKGKKAEKPGNDEKPNGMLKQYIAMFPFIRKKELGEIAANPDKALPKEMESSTADRGLRDALSTSLIFTTIALFLWLIFSIPALVPMLKSIPAKAAMVLSVYAVSLLITVISAALGLVSSAGVYYIIARLLGGKGTFGKTMGMLGTISGPINLLNIALLALSSILMAVVSIFLAGLFGIAYVLVLFGGIALVLFNLYLNYRMVRLLHGLSMARSAVVVTIPILALTAIVAAFLPLIMSICTTVAYVVPH
jgi:hypothetical protein